jgi:AcrR family transcriptional regulator
MVSLLSADAEDRRVESSHDRILHTARELFARDGYENTTTAAIARRAGTSESQLIKHFGSKEGLLEAVFEQAWQGLAAGLAQAHAQYPGPVERLGAVSELLIGTLERDRDLRTLMLLEGRRIRRHGRMVLMTEGYLRLVHQVDALLEEMRQAGRATSSSPRGPATPPTSAPRTCAPPSAPCSPGS